MRASEAVIATDIGPTFTLRLTAVMLVTETRQNR